MNRHRIFLAGLLTLALGFGLWVSAVDLQPTVSSFSEGDIVTASDFNTLFGTIDQNFSDTETAIDELETDKLDLTGGTMTGPLQIAFDGDGDDIGLLVKKTGAGPLMIAMNEDTGQGLQVDADGSLLVGTSGSPEITLDTATGDAILTGTVRNGHGDNLLPVAFGLIGHGSSGAFVRHGTSNVVSATYDESLHVYSIELSDIEFDFLEYVAVATIQDHVGTAIVGASYDGDLLVWIKPLYSQYELRAYFTFVIYDPQN